jgi:uncharacterized phiE125 gp8 family phage protein
MTVTFYQHRGNRLTTAPAAEPVSADDLRTHLRATSTELPDAEADDIIEDARKFIEDTIGIAFINQTWRLSIDRWPGGREAWWDGVRETSITEIYNASTTQSLYLPRYPLSSITSITTYDEDSNSTAVTVANVFDVDTNSLPGRITLKRGQTWPVALRANNAIEIVYVAGYGTAGTDVPSPEKRAIKQMAAYMYSHRGDDCDPANAFIKSGASSIFDSYRTLRV